MLFHFAWLTLVGNFAGYIGSVSFLNTVLEVVNKLRSINPNLTYGKEIVPFTAYVWLIIQFEAYRSLFFFISLIIIHGNCIGYTSMGFHLYCNCNSHEHVRVLLCFCLWILVCDPVMGDEGKLYVPTELVSVYREKVSKSNIIGR